MTSKDSLKFSDLALPHYRNSSTAITAKGRIESTGAEKIYNLETVQAGVASVIAGLNLLITSDTGGGKTQFLFDVRQHYFGGLVASGG